MSGGTPSRSRLKRQVVLVEDPQHDLLAQHRGQRRDAEVDLAAFDRHLEAAVLRLVVLGDVHFAHDLDARDECRVHVARGRSASYIWPSTRKRTTENLRLGSMWMSLAPALIACIKQVVHQVDDRAAVDQGLDVHQVDVGAVGLQLDGALVDVGGHRVDFKAFIVAAGQRPLDAAAEGEHWRGRGAA